MWQSHKPNFLGKLPTIPASTQPQVYRRAPFAFGLETAGFGGDTHSKGTLPCVTFTTYLETWGGRTVSYSQPCFFPLHLYQRAKRNSVMFTEDLVE